MQRISVRAAVAAFFGIWLVAIAMLCAARLDVTLAGLAAFAISAIAFCCLRWIGGVVVKSPWTTVVMLTLALVSSLFITRTYYWITWDPIGTEDDGWGMFPSIFQDAVHEWDDVPLGNGLVAAMRRTSSGLLSVDFPSSYFVFIHRPGEKDSQNNLIFRYFATERGFDSPPEVTWQLPKSIVVNVAAGDIRTITKERSNVDGVQIRYVFRHPEQSSELSFWQRPFF